MHISLRQTGQECDAVLIICLWLSLTTKSLFHHLMHYSYYIYVSCTREFYAQIYDWNSFKNYANWAHRFIDLSRCYYNIYSVLLLLVRYFVCNTINVYIAITQLKPCSVISCIVCTQTLDMLVASVISAMCMHARRTHRGRSFQILNDIHLSSFVPASAKVI